MIGSFCGFELACTPMSTLIFLPGLAADADLWADQTRALPHDLRWAISLVHFRHPSIRAMAAAVLREHPGPLALCGTSMGGMIALEALRQAPERITGLALLGSNARPETEAMRGLRRGRQVPGGPAAGGDRAQHRAGLPCRRCRPARPAGTLLALHPVGRWRSAGATERSRDGAPRRPRTPEPHRMPHAGGLWCQRPLDTARVLTGDGSGHRPRQTGADSALRPHAHDGARPAGQRLVERLDRTLASPLKG